MRCETIQLDDGHARLTVAEEGGAILRYDALQAGAAPLPLMKLAENGKAFGCQVLVPFSNRISGGGFTFDGRFHAIEPNVPGEAFPIHGDGFQKPWRVVSSSPTEAELANVLTFMGWAVPEKLEALIKTARRRRAAKDHSRPGTDAESAPTVLFPVRSPIPL